MQVAIRVRTARPAEIQQFKVAFRRCIERRGVIGRAQLQVDAGFREHGLQHLRHLIRHRVVAEGEFHTQLLKPCSLQQGLRLRDIAFGGLDRRIEVRAVRRYRLADRREDPAADHLIDRIAVDGKYERLAHAFVLERLRRARSVRDVEREVVETESAHRNEVEVLVAFHRCHVGRRETFQHVERTRTQVREAHGAVRNRLEDDFLDRVFIGVPVAREFLQHHAVVLHTLDELVRTGADRMRGNSPVIGERFRREHHTGAIGERREQRRVRRF